MSVPVKQALKCPRGGTPNYFEINNYSKVCNCHGNSNYVSCDGTEENSYCLLGCATCYKMIKKKNEREDKVLKDLRERLVKAENEILAFAAVKRELAGAKKDLACEKRELVKVKNELAEVKKKFSATNEELNLYKQVEEARDGGLAGAGSFSQIFCAPILQVILKHHTTSASPCGISYNLHLHRLVQASTYFDKWSNAQFASNGRIPTVYESKTDHPVAFKYFVEYLYSGIYSIASYEDIACLIHTLVYFLSAKFGVQGLMDLSLQKLKACLQDGNRTPVEDRVVVKMVESTYEGTQCDNEEDDGEATPCASTVGGDNLECMVVYEKHPVETKSPAQAPKDTIGTLKATGHAEDPAQVKASLDLDESKDAAGEIVVSDPHPMRLLVSSYAAQRLEALNKRSDFRALLRRFPEFTVDMMIAEKLLSAQK